MSDQTPLNLTTYVYQVFGVKLKYKWFNLVTLDYLNLSGEKYKWFNLVALDYLNLSGEKYKWFNLVVLITQS
jgi:hypothetical protein